MHIRSITNTSALKRAGSGGRGDDKCEYQEMRIVPSSELDIGHARELPIHPHQLPHCYFWCGGSALEAAAYVCTSTAAVRDWFHLDTHINADYFPSRV